MIGLQPPTISPAPSEEKKVKGKDQIGKKKSEQNGRSCLSFFNFNKHLFLSGIRLQNLSVAPSKEEDDAHSTTSYVFYPILIVWLLVYKNYVGITLAFYVSIEALLLVAVGAVVQDSTSGWRNVLKREKRSA